MSTQAGTPGTPRRKGYRDAKTTTANLPEHLQSADGRRVARASTRLAIPRTDEDEGWAPVREIERVCRDRAGRWRRSHEWDKDSRCLYCPAEKAVDW
jgi:hypothetical protein